MQTSRDTGKQIMSESEIRRYQQILGRIGRQESKGAVFVVEQTGNRVNSDDDYAPGDGCLFLNGIPADEMVFNVIEGFGMKPLRKAMLIMSLVKMLKEDIDD